MTPRPPIDELLALFRSTIAREGTTTGAGAATGDSIIDAGLIGIGANSFFTMLMVVYPGDFNLVDSMDITAFNNATGEITLSSAYKGVAAAIPAGVPYKIVTFRFVPAEVAALLTILNNVFNIVNTSLMLTETGGTVTLTAPGTEDNVYINDAPAGVFEPRLVTIDLSDLAGGEVATVRTRYRIKSGGTARLKGAPVIFNGVQAEPMKDIVLQPNRFGVVVTIEGTTGVVVDWEVHYEV